MTNFNTELYTALAQGISLDTFIRSELEIAMNQLLQTELTVFLDYERYDPIGYNSGNSRNGNYTRTVKTKYGEVCLTIPRDRNGDFNQQTIPPYKRQTDDLETTILQLYSKGITTSEIADLIEKMYGHAYTPQTVSYITQAIETSVDEFHKRLLSKRYLAVYGDSTYLNVRRDSVSKEALHILIGITPEGYKEVLDYRIYPQESADNYREMLKDIQMRGCEEVLLFITDGLTGIRDACLEVYPKAMHQTCWVHLQRNVSRLVRAKDRKEILEQLKPVYQATEKSVAIDLLENFKASVKKRYPKVVAMFDKNKSLFEFLDFPRQIQRSLYTTNLIEGFNKHLKRYTRRKEQFPNEESLDRFVCSQVIEYNHKGIRRIHKGFDIVQSEIETLFEEKYH
ncbi:IS256 family transposase [Erysipelothrix inopinata]|uniref:Mutator family transposase n=1 Tax=Erysipelothrix inopinata TaxID=225084 RepID=A0A7G9RZP9_9FIRM|nr:IS256 family transposase [Erysipelothrix inopinata]QNN61074.1 IS256 family transposase [Erysipelothrix inopinata]